MSAVAQKLVVVQVGWSFSRLPTSLNPAFSGGSRTPAPAKGRDGEGLAVFQNLQALEQVHSLVQLVIVFRNHFALSARVFILARAFVLGRIFLRRLWLGWGFVGLAILAIGQMAFKVRFAPSFSTPLTVASSTTMSGVMPLAWMERPFGVK